MTIIAWFLLTVVVLYEGSPCGYLRYGNAVAVFSFLLLPVIAEFDLAA